MGKPDLKEIVASALVARIRNGNRQAEEEFVALYRRGLRVMLRARLGDPEAADELLNEVLMAVLVALRNGHLQKPESLTSYVLGTARNLANNHIRGKGRQPRNVPLSPDIAAEAIPDGLEQSERMCMLRDALGRLNDNGSMDSDQNPGRRSKTGRDCFSAGSKL